MEVSWNGSTPKSSGLKKIRYKPSILGYLHFWKPSYDCIVYEGCEAPAIALAISTFTFGYHLTKAQRWSRWSMDAPRRSGDPREERGQSGVPRISRDFTHQKKMRFNVGKLIVFHDGTFKWILFKDCLFTDAMSFFEHTEIIMYQNPSIFPNVDPWLRSQMRAQAGAFS